jgi:hypothetical protein
VRSLIFIALVAGAARADALDAFRECAGLQQRIAAPGRVIPRGTRIEVISSDENSDTHLLLRRGRCDADGFALSGERDGGRELQLLGIGLPEPSLAEVARRLDGIVADNSRGAELAAARALVVLDEGRLPPQPEQPGRPLASPTAIWPAAAVRQIVPDYAGDTLVTPPVEPRLLAATDSVEIWEARLASGGLIAVYERARDRHRWLWGTHADASDSFHIVSLDKTAVVIETDGRHHTRIVYGR